VANKAYSLWRKTPVRKRFRFVANFSFDGQESSSKPPQAICKPIANINMRLSKNIIFILLISCLTSSFKLLGQCDTDAEILGFLRAKNGNECWGWVIKIGNDTVRSKQVDFFNCFNNNFPKQAKVRLGEKIESQVTVDYPFYNFLCVDIIDTCCNNIVWNQTTCNSTDSEYNIKFKMTAFQFGIPLNFIQLECNGSIEDEIKIKETRRLNNLQINCLNSSLGENWMENFNKLSKFTLTEY
tara:strand:- start:40 stop:759 length:720 start_codon:yes stop_codon:yes gene_type:complete